MVKLCFHTSLSNPNTQVIRPQSVCGCSNHSLMNCQVQVKRLGVRRVLRIFHKLSDSSDVGEDAFPCHSEPG